jgi:subtilisin family serine protease
MGESILTDFSNYGAKIVDVLAPGNKIYSTLPGKNNHGYLSGTSMAGPIVSNIAALIRSYFPLLSAQEVKNIIMKSVWTPTDKEMSFAVPQRDSSKTLAAIAKAGGIVNAANAIALAKTMSINPAVQPNKKKRINN